MIVVLSSAAGTAPSEEQFDAADFDVAGVLSKTERKLRSSPLLSSLGRLLLLWKLSSDSLSDSRRWREEEVVVEQEGVGESWRAWGRSRGLAVLEEGGRVDGVEELEGARESCREWGRRRRAAPLMVGRLERGETPGMEVLGTEGEGKRREGGLAGLPPASFVQFLLGELWMLGDVTL